MSLTNESLLCEMAQCTTSGAIADGAPVEICGDNVVRTLASASGLAAGVNGHARSDSATITYYHGSGYARLDLTDTEGSPVAGAYLAWNPATGKYKVAENGETKLFRIVEKTASDLLLQSLIP